MKGKKTMKIEGKKADNICLWEGIGVHLRISVPKEEIRIVEIGSQMYYIYNKYIRNI